MGCNSSHPAQSAAAQKAGLPASPPSKRAASIVIVGASGFVGKATVNALCKVVSGVKVATRNPGAYRCVAHVCVADAPAALVAASARVLC
jgi:hypothetical protein